MGAVKTNRRMEVINYTYPFQYLGSYGDFDRDFRKDRQELRLAHSQARNIDFVNNRRKIAGLPMVRRARS